MIAPMPTATRHPLIRASLGLIAGVALLLAFIRSVSITVAWWGNELPETRAIDWFWILMLPVLIGIYLRYFSVFRPDCRACSLEDRPLQGGPGGP
jgi:hypothetical protein